MTTDHATVVPTPLNPRDPDRLVQHLSPGDRVRIATTDRPRTICTVAATNPPAHSSPLLVLIAPPLTTTAQQATQYAHYHCTTTQTQSDAAPIPVVEYTHTTSDTTTRCIGTLTTIARLPALSTPSEADTATPKGGGDGR
ncbi:hypothetical protein [Haladaptatus halobius]|uniref:hypothetical protein n=1 Tax=Haladaptatus halobius TaxID=2884875 RepID=UPI001D09D6F9|nr:hypothetical protein [Haladaptatus halobius]